VRRLWCERFLLVVSAGVGVYSMMVEWLFISYHDIHYYAVHRVIYIFY